MEIFFRNDERISILLKRGNELAETLNRVKVQFEALELPGTFTEQNLYDLLDWDTDIPEYIRAIAFPAQNVGKISVAVPTTEISGLDELIEAVNQARVESFHNFPITQYGLRGGKVVFLGKDQVEAENTSYAKSEEEQEMLKSTKKLHQHLNEYLSVYPNVRFNEVFEISRGQVELNTRYLPTMLTGGRTPIAKKIKPQINVTRVS